METETGVELTDEEVKLVQSLQKLAKQWKKHGERLWLYSASGTLNVMLREGENNPNPLHGGGAIDRLGVNPDNIITIIDIPNDGGDW